MTTAQDALDQIDNQKYYSPYLNSDREVILLGIAFSKEVRNINDWIVKELT